MVGGRSPGSRAYSSAPSRSPRGRFRWLALARRDEHPRSQWRVRAGFAPASLHHRPLWTLLILHGVKVGVEIAEPRSRRCVELRFLREKSPCVVEVVRAPERERGDETAVL